MARLLSLESNGDRVTVDAAGLGQVAAVAPRALPTGADLVVAIRPEKLTLHTTEPEASARVTCRMQNTAYLGDRSHYFVDIDGAGRPLAVSAQNADPAVARELAAGSGLWLSWAEDALLVLPATS